MMLPWQMDSHLWLKPSPMKNILKTVRKSSRYISQDCLYLRLLIDDSDQKSGCNNYRAINAANLNRKNRDATGIGACACARHGCFIPHTVVDFQKGERYEPLVK